MLASIFRFGFVIVALVVTSAISYRYGVRQVETDETRLLAEVDALRTAKTSLESDALRHQSEVRTVEIRYEELQRRFETEMPSGPLRELTELAAARLAEGLDPERLAFYIREASDPRDCSPMDSKRFVMPTPAYQGADGTVSFNNGRISVTGLGENAVAANGGIQGWFDPASEISITLTVIDGGTETISGVLPLYKSIILEDKEFRFAFQQGRRSFVQVTADRCTFP
jgi:hypothetical protein